MSQATDNKAARASHLATDTNPIHPNHTLPTMNGWSIFFLILLILILLLYTSWILLTRLRAHSSNLPAPPWKSYLFIGSRGPAYSGAPTPRSGGVVGWVRDRWDAVRRGRRRERGQGYEDEVWDSRVGGGGGGYFEEQELGGARDGYDGGLSAGAHVHVHADEEMGRGRSRSRSRSRERGEHSPPPPYDPITSTTTNVRVEDPFGDGAERSELRDVSPRPDGGKVQGEQGNGDEERRSIFREGL